MNWIDYQKKYDNESYQQVINHAVSVGTVFSHKKFIDVSPFKGELNPNISVSIVMTNYKRTCYVPYALESLRSQFSKLENPKELIFVDDNSGDNCEELIKEFAGKSGWRTTFCQTGKNITWNESLSANIGVMRLASGELLILNDADTILLGKSVENILRIHSNIENLWLTPVARDLGQRKFEMEAILDQEYVMSCPIGSCIMRYQGASVRRKYWLQCGGFNENYIGWASIDDELHNELSEVGVVFSQCLKVNVEDFPCPVEVPEARSGQPMRENKMSKEQRGRLPETGYVWRKNYGTRIMKPHENYDEYWGFTSFKDKTILDLGADWGSTACYFLDHGAKKVIAVEGNEELAKELLINYGEDPNVICVQKWVKTPADLHDLVLTYKPDMVKVDIEGDEACLLETDADIIKSVKEWLIETHDQGVFENSITYSSFIPIKWMYTSVLGTLR